MGYISLLLTLLVIGLGIYFTYGRFTTPTATQNTESEAKTLNTNSSIPTVIDSAKNAKALMEGNNIEIENNF